jgi:hypothetical protein
VPARITSALPPWQSVQPSTTVSSACMFGCSMPVWQLMQPHSPLPARASLRVPDAIAQRGLSRGLGLCAPSPWRFARLLHLPQHVTCAAPPKLQPATQREHRQPASPRDPASDPSRTVSNRTHINESLMVLKLKLDQPERPKTTSGWYRCRATRSGTRSVAAGMDDDVVREQRPVDHPSPSPPNGTANAVLLQQEDPAAACGQTAGSSCCRRTSASASGPHRSPRCRDRFPGSRSSTAPRPCSTRRSGRKLSGAVSATPARSAECLRG